MTSRRRRTIKARAGFVSNSSAASFVLVKDKVPPDLLAEIRAFLATLPTWDDDPWGWQVTETATEVRGRTAYDSGEYPGVEERIETLFTTYFRKHYLEPHFQFKWDTG